MSGVCATSGAVLSVPADVRRRLEDVATVTDASRADGADWWPISKVWARQGRSPAEAALRVRPHDAASVAAVLASCSADRVPVTPAGGRSGVCGGAVPVAGGVALDVTALDRILDLDEDSLLVSTQAGVTGGALEEWLAERGYSTGHVPQSVDISTVGGWVACRSAGQWSTRYGKAEDMVRGLEVALADGSLVRVPARPARSTGPDLLRLFCGSEGTLGVITEVTMAVHPSPAARNIAAFRFERFEDGLDAIRRVMRRGARPPVLRLYDEAETGRHYASFVDSGCLLLTLTEGEEGLVRWESDVLSQECHVPADPAAVEEWLEHRNDVSALDVALDRGFVVDTCEVGAPWRVVAAVYEAGLEALRSVPGTVAATGHCSHAYGDGACLYFTLAGWPGEGQEEKDRWYLEAWEALLSGVRSAGASISHHHGVGLLRSSWMGRELDSGLPVLQSVKDALDPVGILNPGKLGMADRLGVGSPAWPAAVGSPPRPPFESQPPPRPGGRHRPPVIPASDGPAGPTPPTPPEEA